MPGLVKKTAKLPAAPPMEANDVAIVTGGTVLWLLGFLVLIPFHSSLAAHGKGDWPWICLAGFALGLLGIWYCRRRRDAIRAARERDAGRESAERRAPQAQEEPPA
ncbi:DUF2530 domain-containing protein [Streptacidiphilus sp. MAP5-3]|uniref:DUF2530 domain-containing protein n=1 Tax=unclassified Streptacidiphilus TaxID=2643834 RepID=UPI00351359D3